METCYWIRDVPILTREDGRGFVASVLLPGGLQGRGATVGEAYAAAFSLLETAEREGTLSAEARTQGEAFWRLHRAQEPPRPEDQPS